MLVAVNNWSGPSGTCYCHAELTAWKSSFNKTEYMGSFQALTGVRGFLGHREEGGVRSDHRQSAFDKTEYMGTFQVLPGVRGFLGHRRGHKLSRSSPGSGAF